MNGVFVERDSIQSEYVEIVFLFEIATSVQIELPKRLLSHNPHIGRLHFYPPTIHQKIKVRAVRHFLYLTPLRFEQGEQLRFSRPSDPG